MICQIYESDVEPALSTDFTEESKSIIGCFRKSIFKERQEFPVLKIWECVERLPCTIVLGNSQKSFGNKKTVEEYQPMSALL